MTAARLDDALPAAVREAFAIDADARVLPIDIGLINRTYRVERTRAEPRALILQRLHPIFRGELNHDFEAVTAHLAQKGVHTPRLVPTTSGALWLDTAEGAWRAQTFLEGRVVSVVSEPGIARAAGAAAGRFHVAVSDLRHTFHFTRPGAHDTPRHLAHLRTQLAAHANHPRFSAIEPVAERILAHALPAIPALPLRIIHGDLKLTNVLFDDGLTRAVALLDLDTLAHGTLAVELGDALRSWANPAGESAEHARVDLGIVEAALSGYAQAAGALLTDAEKDALPAALETIALELSSRFCADALEERYFGWDPARYASRGEHNLARARSQLALAESVSAQREALRAIVARTFERAGSAASSPPRMA
jgi:Ser/Thr protein kinase RdoA (MazF antagonist)